MWNAACKQDPEKIFAVTMLKWTVITKPEQFRKRIVVSLDILKWQNTINNAPDIWYDNDTG